MIEDKNEKQKCIECKSLFVVLHNRVFLLF